MDDDEDQWQMDQIGQDLVTLAGLPPARWQNLHNLDIIKARNKPKELVRKPHNAPFFLPTITSADGQTRFNLEEELSKEKGKAKKQIVLEQSLTNWGQKLWDAREHLDNSAQLIQALKDMGPSAIDLEIISLSPEGGGSIELLVVFIKVLHRSLQDHKDFEAVQAYLGLLLKHHSDIILNNEELIEAISELRPVMNESWHDLKQTMTSASTLVSFAKNSLLTSG